MWLSVFFCDVNEVFTRFHVHQILFHMQCKVFQLLMLERCNHWHEEAVCRRYKEWNGQNSEDFQ